METTQGDSKVSEDVIAEDIKESVEIMTDFVQQADAAVKSVLTLLERVKNDEFETSKGISFLEVKYQMLLSYLINLTYVIHKKTTGQRIEGEESIERLVEIRTVLEKMRPIDQKLKYQIDKLLTTSATGVTNPDDPINLRANVRNTKLIGGDGETSEETSDDEMSEGDSDAEEDKEKPTKTKAYVPPKVSAVHYDGDDTAQDRRQKQLEKARKRALNSTIIEELKREYDDGPEEILDCEDVRVTKHKKERKEIQEYEEEYMTRIPLTKKQKHDSKQLSTMSSLRKLARFENITALDADVDDFPLKQKSRSKKQGKKKGKRKSFRGRRKH